MCIIAIKDKGIDYPDSETIQNMFCNNSDGAGYMYTLNNKVYIRKGFMTLEDFNQSVEELSQKVNLTDIPMVLHFRITTHGDTNPENTHPFVVTKSKSLLKKLYVTTDLAMVHNGIIDIYQYDKTISDTMQYILDVVYPLKKLHRYFYNSEYGKELLDHTADSKLAFLNQKGEIATVGTFITGDDGLVYSNTTYKSYNMFTNYRNRNKTYDDNYNCDYDCSIDTYYYDDVEPQLVKWVMPLCAENVSVVYTNGDIDSPEDYFVDIDGTPYIYSYYDDSLIEADAYIDGDVAFNYSEAEKLPVMMNLTVLTKEQAINGI